MKQIMLFVLTLYQTLLSPLMRQLLGTPDACRYSPSCSEYTKQMIQKHGIMKGGRMGLSQFFTCHPFAKYGTV